MTRFFLSFVFLLAAAFLANGQAIKGVIRTYNGSITFEPDSLARSLTRHLHSETDKVDAIVRWITGNIEYQVTANKYAKLVRNLKMHEDTAYDSRSLDERVAYNVLRRGSAVCDGYARLFKTMCDAIGIEAVIVSGYARSQAGKHPVRFATNHTWNAVRIQGAWELLDVTWASGYIDAQNKFVRSYDPEYYRVPPLQMIRSHYPEDPRWTLLPAQPVLHEYELMPFRTQAFTRHHVQSFYPLDGTLQAQAGDTLQFWLQLAEATIDSSARKNHQDTSNVLIYPLKQKNGKTVRYRYIVQPGVDWVNLVFEDEVILRYRVRVFRSERKDRNSNLR